MVREPASTHPVMVTSSTSIFATIPSTFFIPITEKLSKHNYLLWRAQIMPPIRAARYEDLLLGIEKALSKTISVRADDSTTEKPLWMSRDQVLLGYLLSSQVLLGYLLSPLAHEVLMGVITHTSTASVNTRITLATTKKGTSTMADYFAKMKNYADDMSAFGQPLRDEEFAAYVLTGLDEELYNALVSSIVTRVEPISHSELYSQMLSYEHRVDKQSSGGGYSMSSVNAATRGHGSS
jgi:hypothetical protein